MNWSERDMNWLGFFYPLIYNFEAYSAGVFKVSRVANKGLKETSASKKEYTYLHVQFSDFVRETGKLNLKSVVSRFEILFKPPSKKSRKKLRI